MSLKNADAQSEKGFTFPEHFWLSESLRVGLGTFELTLYFSNPNTSVSQMFCNILVCASLWCIYNITKGIQVLEGICYGW